MSKDGHKNIESWQTGVKTHFLVVVFASLELTGVTTGLSVAVTTASKIVVTTILNTQDI